LLLRNYNSIIICALGPLDLSDLILRIGNTEIHRLGDIFPESRSTLTEQCWCIHQGHGAVLPTPSCGSDNTALCESAGFDWNFEEVQVELGSLSLGKCHPQEELGEQEECVFDLSVP